MQYQNYLRGGKRLWTPRSEPGLWSWWDPTYTAGITTVDAAVASPNDVSTADWTATNLSARTADTITDTVDGGDASHSIAQAVAQLVTGKPATLTLDLHPGTLSQAYFALGTAVAYLNAADGTSSGASGCTVTSIALAAGWYRFTVSITAPSSTTLSAYTANAVPAYSYQGGGSGTIQIRNIFVEQRNVSALADRSGNGYILSQNTAVYQPTLITSDASYAGRQTLNLAGGAFLALASWTLPQPFTFYFVGHVVTTATWANVATMRAPSTVSIYTTGGLLRLTCTAGTGLAALNVNPRVPCVIATIFNGASSSIYVSSTTPKITGNVGALASTRMTIGNALEDLLPTNGKMAYGLMYSVAHSASSVARVVRNLARQYGVSL